MQSLKIISICVAAAISYGILHDQITIRICLEYFTIGHPQIIDSRDPTILALAWGFLATWWVGLMLGILLAIAARAGSKPRRSALTLIRPVLRLIIVTTFCAVLAGEVGWLLARNGLIFLTVPLAEDLPSNRHFVFLADLWAHTASYAAGIVGGLAIVILVWRSRSKMV